MSFRAVVGFTETVYLVTEGVDLFVTLGIFKNGNADLSANVSFRTIAQSASEGMQQMVY